MAKDQPGNNRSSSSSSSPPARRRARQVTQAKVVSNEGARRSRRSHNSTDDWLVPDEESSGWVRKLALVAGGVVAVVALGMVWQSSLGPGPIPAAEHPSISVGTQTSETSEAPTKSTNRADESLNSTGELSKPTNLQEIWKGRLAELDNKRAKAFENRDLEALGEINVPNSPAQAHDIELLAALEDHRVMPVSLATTIHSAALVSGDNDSALVEIVDSRNEYVVTTESMNKTIKRFKANEHAKWRVSLRNSERGWRIYSVSSTDG